VVGFNVHVLKQGGHRPPRAKDFSGVSRIRKVQKRFTKCQEARVLREANEIIERVQQAEETGEGQQKPTVLWLGEGGSERARERWRDGWLGDCYNAVAWPDIF
jgi:hypothetical protein